VSQWLNVLGMPGMTGYFGLMDIGQPKANEILLVSGAAGAVGQTVGQLAKIKGLHAVAIAEMAGYLREGRMKSREDVVEGEVQVFPATLLKLFNGQNFGKLLLEVAKE
jgi:NADPH-dependent curcumin reductase CurA